ncbi:MAG: class F sortase [Actinomycetota bacterium]|nr:class F sortase [Actinomycetota bacterium]
MTAHGRHQRSHSQLTRWCNALAVSLLALALVALGIYFRLHVAKTDLVSVARSSTSNLSAAQATPSTLSAINGVAPETALATPGELSPPIHLTIASIGVSTDLQRLSLVHKGSLQAPTKWEVAGWYANGVVPGQVGPAVIAGHVDSTRGPAVFYRLHELAAGATISVTEQNAKVLHFVVDDVREYPKKYFPTKTVYGPTPTPELRLISCTGEFDHSSHSYLNNVVVSAHLL